jgi:hypothetical protein
MRQIGVRDEARLLADYERCGQFVCCRTFIKDFQPVSMRMAKLQKATLDPTKISGRCGRLMCCLRYEYETYEALRKNLPKRNTYVMTEDGPGRVVATHILTQLVKVDIRQKINVVPVESITRRNLTEEEVANWKPEIARSRSEPQRERRRRPRRKKSAEGAADAVAKQETPPPAEAAADSPQSAGPAKPKRRRRSRRSRRGKSREAAPQDGRQAKAAKTGPQDGRQANAAKAGPQDGRQANAAKAGPQNGRQAGTPEVSTSRSSGQAKRRGKTGLPQKVLESYGLAGDGASAETPREDGQAGAEPTAPPGDGEKRRRSRRSRRRSKRRKSGGGPKSDAGSSGTAPPTSNG